MEQGNPKVKDEPVEEFEFLEGPPDTTPAPLPDTSSGEEEEEAVEEDKSPAGAKDEPPPPEEELGDVVELGDHILVQGGKYDRLRGVVYYRSGELIHILPEGLSNKIVVIELDDEGDPKEEYGIRDIQILSKRPKEENYPFVDLLDIHTGDIVETFDAEGEYSTKFIAGKVLPEEDIVELKVAEDESSEYRRYEFDFMGIRPEYGFYVMRPSEPVVPKQPVKPVEEEEEEEEAKDLAPVAPPSGEGDTIFEFTMEEVDLPVVEKIEEIKGYLERPKDSEQKLDMFEDLMKKFGESGKRNPRIKREQKILMESLFQLRNSLVSYSPAGDIQGYKPTSLTTLGELLKQSRFPLARPVIETARVLHLDHTAQHFETKKETGEGVDPTTYKDSGVEVQYLQDIVESMIQYMETNWETSEGGQKSDDDPRAVKDILPQWYIGWQSFFDNYFTTLPLIGQGTERIMEDADVFRGEIPKVPATALRGKSTKEEGKEEEKEESKDEIETPTLVGFPRLNETEESMVTSSLIGKVSLSRLRALRSKLIRFGPKNKLDVSESADVINVLLYILFPLFYLREFGTTRSGNLALDIAQSMFQLKPTGTVLAEAGSVTETPVPNAILAVKPEGSLASQVSIADWLAKQTLLGKGIGDLMPLFRSLGLQEKELTLEQMEVLKEKIDAYRGAIKHFLNEERERASAEAANKAVQVDTVLPLKDASTMIQKIRDEPVFESMLQGYAQRYPLYRETDLGSFSYVYKSYQDLLLAVLAQVPEPLLRERERYKADFVLSLIRINERLKEREENAAQPPVPNECYHVSDYNIIKKTDDDAQRLKLLAKLLTNFRAPDKKDHWIWCIACDGHLMCEHEFLQIQEYLYPKEAKNIHKELLLHFSDGVSVGKYLCKNCGQAIADLDYDNHLEFDDEGNPMSNRAELVDEEGLKQEELAMLLGNPTEGTQRIDFGNEDKNKIYFTLRQIAELVGVFPTDDGYRDMVDFMSRELSAQPTKARYVAIQKAQDAADAEARKKGEKVPTRTKVDYEIFIHRFLVCGCGATLLLHIQSRIPDYVVRYTLPGCKFPEFTGFPLGTNPEEKNGIEYIACAISSIKRLETPWKDTGFLQVASDEKRQQAISFNVTRWTTEFIKRAEIQIKLAKKKQYLLDTFGKEALEGRPNDVYPDGFMPQQIVLPKEKAALNPILESAAKGSDKSEAWILTAHALAGETSMVAKGEPHLVNTSCVAELVVPGKFWKENSMPTLPPKEPPAGESGSILRVPLTLRPAVQILGKADESIMYKLFTRVCYTGPRLGYPHEPGYDWICPHCKFRFPENPRIGPVQGITRGSEKEFKAEQEALNMAEQQSLERAGIKVTRETFEKLLDEVHNRYKVDKFERPTGALTGLALLERLASLTPPLFSGYRETLIPLIEALRSVADKKPTLREYSDLYADFSEAVNAQEQALTARLKKENLDLFLNIFSATPQRIAEVVRANYLVPFQQVVTKLKTESLKKVKASYNLGQDTLQDIRTFLTAHLQIVDTFSDRILIDSFPEAKLKEAIERLSMILPWYSFGLRANIIPGAKVGFSYLIRFFLLGIFVDLVDPNHVPANFTFQVTPTESVLADDSRKLFDFLFAVIKKTAIEKIDLTEDQIREMCEARAELEKANRITKIDRKSRSLKELDKVQKALGLGDYRIKENAIRSYDEEQYERDKLEMEQMGVNRFQYLYADGNITVPTNMYTAEKGAGYDTHNKEDLHDD